MFLQACPKALGMPLFSTAFVVAADSSDVADVSMDSAATMASVMVVVMDTVAMVNSAVVADFLQVLDIWGDSSAVADSTAVADSLGVPDFMEDSAIVMDSAVAADPDSAVAVDSSKALDCRGDFVAVPVFAAAADVLEVLDFMCVAAASFKVPDCTRTFSVTADMLGGGRLHGRFCCHSSIAAAVDALDVRDFTCVVAAFLESPDCAREFAVGVDTSGVPD